MYKTIRNRTKKIGQSPGILMASDEPKSQELVIQMIDYDDSGYFLERQTADLTELAAAIETPSITWINVIGLQHVEMVGDIGKAFGIHPLLLEDILTTDQRPKLEQLDQYITIILKMLHWHEADGRVQTEQVSIVLGNTFVLTFQEEEKDVFTSLRGRIRDGKGRIRKAGADYLAYAILDSIVDHYFLILEQLGDDVEELEFELITAPTPDTLQTIHDLKREMLFLRKTVWPLRELLGGLQRGDSDLFQQATLIYLRDVYEHTIQVIDTLEILRDMVASMLDIYLSSVSNKMNEVMKVLTVIATIFIPLTFITSLYGMNFRYMPELQWHWAYPLLWVALITITIVMLAYFRKKDWL